MVSGTAALAFHRRPSVTSTQARSGWTASKAASQSFRGLFEPNEKVAPITAACSATISGKVRRLHSPSCTGPTAAMFRRERHSSRSRAAAM